MAKQKPNLTQEELLWKIYKSTEKTRKYLMWNRIFSIIKIIIIVIPIILAIIYIPPYIEKITQPYKNFANNATQTINKVNRVENKLNIEKNINQGVDLIKNFVK